MIILDLQNIKIASINNKYGVSKSTGRFYLSDQYRNFKKLIQSNLISISIDPPYKVTILFKGYVDIDNPIKPILDAMQDSGIIDDDKNVLELNCIKIPGKKGQAGHICIFLDRINNHKHYIEK